MQAPAISRVPVEVMREILLVVTHLPNELSIVDQKYPHDILSSGRLDFGPKGTRHICSLQSLRIQLTERRKLALVSKYWYSIMVEVLYRTIFVRNISDIQTLRQLVHGFKAIASSVRRIHIAISPGRFTESSNSRQLLEELINLCPRLALFQDTSGRISLSSWSQKTKDILKHSLQYLDMRELVIETDSRHILALALEVRSFQVLRVLILPPLFIVFHPGLQPLSLPHLEILDISEQILLTESFVSYIAGGELPRLHTLRFSHTPYSAETLARFWKNLGYQLRTIHIDLRSIGRLGPLDRILPNLQQLILYPSDGALNKQWAFKQEYRGANVQILGVDGIEDNMRVVADYVAQAMRINTKMPNLRILRSNQMLMSAHNAESALMR